MVYIALFVDNTLMVWYMKANDDVIAILNKYGLVLKIVEGLQDSCLAMWDFLEISKLG